MCVLLICCAACLLLWGLIKMVLLLALFAVVCVANFLGFG